jgi:hypothetical protein
MEHGLPYRPRVSRETRLLLTTAVVALAVLWGLARLRFPDRPATPNPVPPLLTQLAAGPKFDDLAVEVSAVQQRLQPLLFAAAAASGPSIPFLRIRDDLAIALLDAANGDAALAGVTVVARDRGSRLTVIQAATVAPVALPATWSPRQPEQARYLLATATSADRVSLRPVFVASLDPVGSPLWSTPIWATPTQTEAGTGTFLFSLAGEFAGVVADEGGVRAIVPAAALLGEVERVLASAAQPPGQIGVDVQALTPALSRITGMTPGVVVTWIEPGGPAADAIAVGDVIEAIDGRPVASPWQWKARMARLSAGEPIAVRLRRGPDVREVRLVAGAAAPVRVTDGLGLTLRRVPGAGAEIVRVEPGSRGARAGFAPQDVITSVDRVAAPTPAQIRTAFAQLAQGRALMVAVTRREAHLLMPLDK